MEKPSALDHAWSNIPSTVAPAERENFFRTAGGFGAGGIK